MTPMLLQYFRVKEENPDCLLFFRVGDFFEMYGEDACISSRELEITLTSKDSGGGTKIEMAGVPFFAVDQYLHTLVNKGYRVAVCDQVEDAKKAKGLVKREVIRIVSSGTVTDPTVLDKSSNNYLCAARWRNKKCILAVCDISTGDFFVSETNAQDLTVIQEELDRFRPSEILLDVTLADTEIADYLESQKIIYRLIGNFPDLSSSAALIKKCFNLQTLDSLEISSSQDALSVCAQLIEYLNNTQKSNLLTLRRPKFYLKSDFAIIDSISKKNLELVETIIGKERRGSLLWALDETQTSMGARLLKNWILTPLIKAESIKERLDAVTELINNWTLCEKLKDNLKNIQDIERLLSKAVFASANARDLLALMRSLKTVPEIKKILSNCKCALLTKTALIDSAENLTDYLETSLLENPPATLREGGMIADSFNTELAELRNIRKSGKDYISAMEEREREKTNIKNLKIGFNQVFGYYIEVTKLNIKNIPDNYIRKQTIANGERYITEELKNYESKVLGAEERIKALEFDLFNQIRLEVLKYSEQLQAIASNVAIIDVLLSFANVSSVYGYTKPEISQDCVLDIKEARHPVVERITSSVFVKNDLHLDENNSLSIITGPNMSGKSTYLRQSALIAIMAQIGCYVPANYAKIGIVDKFFTRVGATDDLHLGQSTFMVEMLETANILNNATSKSLVILDEIGRGTSTYDGMSIAQAVVESLYNDIKARALFATHFHELTALAKHYEGISNRRVAVRENDGDIVFLHKILNGASDKSYGIYVAKLAGFPEKVLNRSEEILLLLESSNQTMQTDEIYCKDTPPKSKGQLTFFASEPNPVIDEIRKFNVMETTPLEALNKIYKWQRAIEKFK